MEAKGILPLLLSIIIAYAGWKGGDQILMFAGIIVTILSVASMVKE